MSKWAVLLRGGVAVIGGLAGLLGLGLISLSPRMSWGLRAVVGGRGDGFGVVHSHDREAHLARLA